jgi:hypothetical protein
VRPWWSKANLALAALLASGLLVMAPAVRAEQISVEAAATAAGLAVKTGTADVNGVTMYYRDIGQRSEPVLLLHGFPETGDTFASAVPELGKRYRLMCRICVVPASRSALRRATRRGRSRLTSRR